MEPLAVAKFACHVRGVAQELLARRHEVARLRGSADEQLQRCTAAERGLEAMREESREQVLALKSEAEELQKQLKHERIAHADCKAQLEQARAEVQAVLESRTSELERMQAQQLHHRVEMERAQLENADLRKTIADQKALQEACEKEIGLLKDKCTEIEGALAEYESRVREEECKHDSRAEERRNALSQLERLKGEHKQLETQLKVRALSRN